MVAGTKTRAKKRDVLRCPECRSTRLTKDGTQISNRCRVQRYLCHNCFRRTIYPKKEL